jgi:hypothetical protein
MEGGIVSSGFSSVNHRIERFILDMGLINLSHVSYFSAHPSSTIHTIVKLAITIRNV